MSAPRIVIAALVVWTASVAAQQPSFGEIAREAEKRRETAERPSKTYTNDDLKPVEGRLPACQSEHKYDATSGNAYLIERCPDGTTRVQGSHARTDAKWTHITRPDGSQSATDKCGDKWTFDAQTKTYRSESGEVRQGEDAFRERLESPAPCAGQSPAPPAARASDQSFCTETSRTDSSEIRYVVQRCLDGTVRESATNPRTGATWQSTTTPDGSQTGNNSCGVSWSYNASSDRYETSLGEKGMGRNVFLAHLARINRCEVYRLQ